MVDRTVPGPIFLTDQHKASTEKLNRGKQNCTIHYTIEVSKGSRLAKFPFQCTYRQICAVQSKCFSLISKTFWHIINNLLQRFQIGDVSPRRTKMKTIEVLTVVIPALACNITAKNCWCTLCLVWNHDQLTASWNTFFLFLLFYEQRQHTPLWFTSQVQPKRGSG